MYFYIWLPQNNPIWYMRQKPYVSTQYELKHAVYCSFIKISVENHKRVTWQRNDTANITSSPSHIAAHTHTASGNGFSTTPPLTLRQADQRKQPQIDPCLLACGERWTWLRWVGCIESFIWNAGTYHGQMKLFFKLTIDGIFLIEWTIFCKKPDSIQH